MEPAATAPPVVGYLNVPLVDQAAADLAATRMRSGLSETDIVNRALSLYEFIDGALDAGSEILVRHPDGTVQQMFLLCPAMRQ